ncbi:MAG: hypothetical protein ACI8S6_001396 [Myxococcota bacterium]|jgi:hypothetical protein
MLKKMTLLAAMILTGCDGGAVDSGESEPEPEAEVLEVSLSQVSGCADTWVHAWDAASEVGLSFYLSEPLAAAQRDGSFEAVLDAATVSGLVLEVTAPGEVAINYCTDALSEREVLETYTPSSGTVTFRVVPDGSDDGVAELTLEDVVFTAGSGATIQVSESVIGAIPVINAWGG